MYPRCARVRMLLSSPSTKWAEVHLLYDVVGALIPRKVLDKPASSGIVRADDCSEEGLNLVETAFEREDISDHMVGE